MITFRYHENFEKEIAALAKRQLRSIRQSIEAFQRLCIFHFHPTNPETRIAPGKLHRVTENDIWTIWKTELPVINSGLRPNQYPRIWFMVSGASIVFLCIASHVKNYNDKEMDKLVLLRIGDSP